MAKTYKINYLKEDKAKVSVTYIDDDGTEYTTAMNVPMKEDLSAYTEDEFEDFIVSKWPVHELEAKRQEGDQQKDPFAVIKTKVNANPINITAKVMAKGVDIIRNPN